MPLNRQTQSLSGLRRISLWATLALPWLCPAPGWATTCSVSTNPVPFNIYSTSSLTANTTISSLTVACQSPVALSVLYTISLSAGNSGSASARAMTAGAFSMNYQLYSDATYSTIWGDGTGSSKTVTDGYLIAVLNIPISKTYSLYGQIPARQNIGAGVYGDTITVQVSY